MLDRMRLQEVIDGFDRAPVLLYGDLVLDRFILGTPKRISREAPVIILRFEGQRDVPGGAANALANLAALDVPVTPVAVIGDDEPGDALRRALAADGVRLDRVHTVAGYRTPTKVRILGGGPSSLKHQVARYDIEDRLEPAAPWRAAIQRELAAVAPEVGAVAVSDYGYGVVDPALVGELLARRHAGCRVCLDSRYQLGAFHGVDGVTPNLQELESCAGRRLASDDDVAVAAEQLRTALDAGFVLATRGNRGMSLVERDRPPRHVPVFGTDEVADVTGAGDTVLAVLTAALAAGASAAEAAVLANLAGGLVVMKLGTATITRDELRRAVESAAGAAR